MFIADSKTGPVAEDFMRFVDSTDHKKVEAFGFVNECLAVKDGNELDNLKKSSKVCGYFFSKFIQ